MKIALIANFKANYGGSFISQTMSLAKELERKGNEVIFIFPESAKERTWCIQISKSNRQVLFVKNEGKQFLIYKSLKKIIKTYEVNCIHTNFGFYDNIVALISLLNPKIKCIIHAHGEMGTPENVAKKFGRLIKNKFLLSKVFVIAVGNNIYEEYIKFGFNKKNISVIQNGIEFERLKMGKNRHEVRSELCIGNDEKVFLMMGYSIHTKGIDIACRSFYKLHQENNPNKFVLAIVVASHKEKIKNYIYSKYGEIPSWIRILPPTEKVGEYYRGADFFLSASRTEGFSNALAEALYSELPSIVSNIEGTKWATQLDSVFLFENENTESLNKIINIVSRKHKLLNENSKVSRIVKETYGIHNWIRNLIGFYEEKILTK